LKIENEGYAGSPESTIVKILTLSIFSALKWLDSVEKKNIFGKIFGKTLDNTGQLD
jgi:hypothetical protein